MSNDLYVRLKAAVNAITPSAAIFEVEVDGEGKFKEMRYFAINKSFIMDCMAMFFQNEEDDQKDMAQ